MLTVLICSLFNLAMLIGLLTGIVVGVWRSREAIGDALAFDPLAPDLVDRVRPAAERGARLRSA